LLLRRATTAAGEAIWASGLRLLGEALRQSGWQNHRLVAVNSGAAESMAAIIAHPVQSIGVLDALEGSRPTVPVNRNEPDSAFTFTEASGERQSRRVDVSRLNWARLRRMAQLRAASADDLDMQDLVAFASGDPARAEAKHVQPSQIRCMLVVVPNGVGLGHITRMMAIAKGLQSYADLRVIFWCYSRAAEILTSAGFEVILRQTAQHMDAHPPSWRRWEVEEFARTVVHFDVRLVAVDGGAVGRFIVDALKRPGCGRCGVLWVRRGMLRPETDADMLEHEQVCDLILEPGDLAVEMDQGPTRTRTARNRGFSRKIETRPVTLKPFLPSYTRKEAKKRLNLGWGRHCLVSLGGAFGDWELFQALLQKHAKQAGVKLIWAQSPLAAPPKLSDKSTSVRRFYPLSRYMEAFDGMVTATGYNSYHELILGYRGAVLLAPTNRDRLDDQEARARYAEEQGWAHVVYTTRLQDQERAIQSFMTDIRNGTTSTSRPAFNLDTEFYAREINAVLDRYSLGGGS
jgi:UDP:flavonoid glycosyltransferase YjiC (YdhE family)